MEEGKSHTFKLKRNWPSGRRKNSLLLQDSLSPFDGVCIPLPGYERLFPEEPRQDKEVRQPRKEGWVRKVNWHVFFLCKVDSDSDERKEKERKKKRSSWLPDIETRWPVQGW